MATVRAEIAAVAEVVVADAERWVAAHAVWQAALAERQRVEQRTGRRVLRATGGLGVERWAQALERRRILTVADAQLRARAVRAADTVTAALADQAEQLAVADARLAAAKERLAVESARMASYRHLGARLTGTTLGQLRRLSCLH